MNTRKQHVIDIAHQLFIEKGFQATSIQDILDYSGISKGTFYNYFSSKNELLIALFTTLFKKIEKGQEDLLIGQDPKNIEIFIKQIQYQYETNRANKLLSLFDEVFYSNDEELKQFLKRCHMKSIRWLYERFIDIFGESKKPYLLDCAIMFRGILQNNQKYNSAANNSNVSIHDIVRYSVNRTIKMVEEVAETGEQLLPPELLDSWMPNCKKTNKDFQQKLYHSISTLKKSLIHNEDQAKYIELLDFILEELLHSKDSRKFLIEMAIQSLKSEEGSFEKKELQQLEQLVANYFKQIEEAD
ncbi:TetR/AcrR family transcriptional regulator [Cytobacillus dafuensis]|uniref:TetR/AcrR family transcriptional regulator n=1 Tax=Cytobacillus dafuensis TaxID=1742359 RepID=A0A5B8Z4G5_CYTDA|nr:TetR/AcrR family transcriptional regulator [Cytobacillus dafuensis]QED46519.1 TetR/AcrR family transcriptional regulator [Cytobacillus dafuensis]